MILRARIPPAVPVVLLVLAGCGQDPLGPVVPEDVTITLSVTGGLTSGGYGVVVDGAAGEAHSSCALCGRPAPVVVPISAEQVTALATALDESGVVGLDGTDFGTQCCDQLHVDLTYERGVRSTHVRGSQGLLPDALQRAIELLAPLAFGQVPALYSPRTADSDWPRDTYTLGVVEVESSTLTATLTYGGGCAPHRIDLVAWGAWIETSPVQIEALLTHDDSDDTCDALVTEARSFNLLPVMRAYGEAYPEPDPPVARVLVLRLREPGSTEPRLVEILIIPGRVQVP